MSVLSLRRLSASRRDRAAAHRATDRSSPPPSMPAASEVPRCRLRSAPGSPASCTTSSPTTIERDGRPGRRGAHDRRARSGRGEGGDRPGRADGPRRARRDAPAARRAARATAQTTAPPAARTRRSSTRSSRPCAAPACRSRSFAAEQRTAARRPVSTSPRTGSSRRSLTNVLKHAGGAQRARVARLRRPRDSSIEVVDDGPGPSAPRRPAGHGLVGMRERVGLFGGGARDRRRPGRRVRRARGDPARTGRTT